MFPDNLQNIVEQMTKESTKENQERGNIQEKYKTPQKQIIPFSKHAEGQFNLECTDAPKRQHKKRHLRGKENAQQKHIQQSSREAVLLCEIESLKATLDLKLLELNLERKKAEQLYQAGVDLPKALQAAHAAKTMVKNLNEELKKKQHHEEYLIQENEKLSESLVQALAEKDRFSFLSEQLMYKLENNDMAPILESDYKKASISNNGLQPDSLQSEKLLFSSDNVCTSRLKTERVVSEFLQEEQFPLNCKLRKLSYISNTAGQADSFEQELGRSTIDDTLSLKTYNVKKENGNIHSISWFAEFEMPLKTAPTNRRSQRRSLRAPNISVSQCASFSITTQESSITTEKVSHCTNSSTPKVQFHRLPFSCSTPYTSRQYPDFTPSC